jgi:hypothetical protein
LLGELFPGLPDEFVVAGAVVVDDGHLSRVYARIGRYSAKFAEPRAGVPSGGLTVRRVPRPPTRPGPRQCRSSLRPGRDRTARYGICMTGVRIINRGNGVETALGAELVTDATGRAPRTSAFLDSLGYGGQLVTCGWR